jgi:hypothetical protein
MHDEHDVPLAHLVSSRSPTWCAFGIVVLLSIRDVAHFGYRLIAHLRMSFAIATIHCLK